jgi:uncharacterized membrane protein (DUF4010 family)
MDFDDATNFVIALLIGILVGIEREKKKGELGGERDGAHSFGGIRTHVLLAELGAASAWLSADAAQPWIFIVTLAVTGAAVVASYVLQNRGAEEAPGLTSELAAIVVFLLGGMVVIGDRPLAVALAVVTSALLAYKQPLHGMVGRIDKDDMFAGIKLLIASFIVLPLLPDRTIDPWDAINPYKLWLLVIMISALSLAGYAAMRTLGTAHGTAVTGLTGGLVSSTAATLSFARAARFGASVADSHALAAGILLAWLMMFLRLLVTVGIVNRSLLGGLWLPLGAMAAIVAGFAAWHYRRGLADGKSSSRESVPVRNPFSLTSAMKFGALFAAVLLIVRIVELQAPAGGIYLVAALAGLVDVDAIALSMAVGPGEPAQAGLAIVIAAMSNTAVKCGMTVIYGSGRVRLWIPAATAAILAVGLATSLLNP